MIEGHVKALTDQLVRIITDAVARGQFEVADPEVTARAVFDATSRFHNPANAAAWAEPGIQDAHEGVRSLILAGLTRS